jgi:hypothetical protein
VNKVPEAGGTFLHNNPTFFIMHSPGNFVRFRDRTLFNDPSLASGTMTRVTTAPKTEEPRAGTP